jgi:uncharacterized membrane protein YagU involved in acid resistance
VKQSGVLRHGVMPGALAGLIGGLAFGAAMSQLSMLPTVASLVRTSSDTVGFAVHLFISGLLGAGFGLLVWYQDRSTGETLFWGLTYGILWWFLGPLTLLPLVQGAGLMWDIYSVQELFPSLLGHLWYGAITALVFSALTFSFAIGTRVNPRDEQDETSKRRERQLETSQISAGVLLRGAVSGLLGAWLLGRLLDDQDQLLTFSQMMGAGSRQTAWLLLVMTGLLAGLGYASLYPSPKDSSGAGLVRGVVYGFLWWFAGALTLMPLMYEGRLAWSLNAARSGFAFLPGFVLFGAAVALLYQWLDGLVRALFSDITITHNHERVGVQGLRALGWGALAGTIGGLLFTLVMVQIGFLPTVANLIGSTSQLSGFMVHLVISVLVGASYALLFRHQSYDVGSAVGWGVSYGFVWWILGALTLMPILLGITPQWNVEVAAGSLASLVGHLAYGAGLGIAFHRMEARYNPWWIPLRQAEAKRIKRRKEQLFTSAPALWVMIVVIALTVPIILGS